MLGGVSTSLSQWQCCPVAPGLALAPMFLVVISCSLPGTRLWHGPHTMQRLLMYADIGRRWKRGPCCLMPAALSH